MPISCTVGEAGTERKIAKTQFRAANRTLTVNHITLSGKIKLCSIATAIKETALIEEMQMALRVHANVAKCTGTVIGGRGVEGEAITFQQQRLPVQHQRESGSGAGAIAAEGIQRGIDLQWIAIYAIHAWRENGAGMLVDDTAAAGTHGSRTIIGNPFAFTGGNANGIFQFQSQAILCGDRRQRLFIQCFQCEHRYTGLQQCQAKQPQSCPVRRAALSRTALRHSSCPDAPARSWGC